MMKITIQYMNRDVESDWDQYVRDHSHGSLYHLSGWKHVIEKAYGHQAYYMMAVVGSELLSNSRKKIAGILPLVHMKSIVFGNRLISIPFFDIGGILADDPETEKLLLAEAVGLGRQLKAEDIELRHTQSLRMLDGLLKNKCNTSAYDEAEQTIVPCFTRTHKSRMLLELPAESASLLASFKSKLRSQIKKPMKEGLVAKIGGVDLLDHFYRVFVINMRDLGSPVHSIALMKYVLEHFTERSKIVVVYHDKDPIAASLMIGYQDVLENPWASSLKTYSRLNPNMLLYWTMLEYASDHGFNYFDFGRSSMNEGTYHFKVQWGAEPQQLF